MAALEPVLTIVLMLGLLAAPLAAEAQQMAKVYRIGALEVVSIASNAANLAALRQGLRELGYVEGQNVAIEYRSADGWTERFPDLASELVRLKVDVIVTRGTPAALAAKHATRTIPIIMASSGDPVLTGIVASLAHPGGNVTGLSAFGTERQGKQVELVREMVPQIVRVAFLYNVSNPVLEAEWKEAGAVARSVGLQPQQHARLVSVLRGHYAYYGLPSNWHRLDSFYDAVRRCWYRVLRRRSQRSLTWASFTALEARFPLPQPRITHPLFPLAPRLGTP